MSDVFIYKMNKSIISKKYYINGPESVSRLEGKINGIKKVIYLFGEVHILSNECDKKNNIDIDKFLLEIFIYNDKKDKDYLDVFLEIYDLNNGKDEILGSYRMMMINRLRSIIANNKEINKRVSKNKKIKNTRFHNFDIRYIFDKYDIHSDTATIPEDIESFDEIIDKLRTLQNNINKFIKDEEILVENKLNRKSKILKKLFDKYETKKCNEILSDITIKYFNILIDIPNKITMLLLRIYTISIEQDKDYKKYNYMKFSKYVLDMITDIFIQYNAINDTLLFTTSFITDLYLLRRILDKKYIKRSIIYCGNAHTYHLKYILIKYFNFKLTHINNNKTDNNYKKQVKEESKFLKELNNNNLLDFGHKVDLMVDNLVYTKKEYTKQCVNLFDFPNNLS